MQELEENAYFKGVGMEMIVLRDCTVGVKDKKEYEKVIQIAKKQRCKWNSGDSLDYIYCPFPVRLFLIKEEESHLGHTIKDIVIIIVKI